MHFKTIAPFVMVYAPIQLRYCNIRIRDGQLISGTVNPTTKANPAVTPTINPTTGGTSGGNLQAGVYFLTYTDVYSTGETLASTESASFTVVAGDIPTVTMTTVPTGGVTRNIYLTPPNGVSGSETFYLSFAAATTVTLQNPYVAGGNPSPVLNSTGNYPAATSTMTVAFTTILVTGQQFTIGGDAPIYKITAHTETLGSTTSITFTPPTDATVLSGEVITVGPNILKIKVGEGNFTYNEKNPIVYVRDRGLLDTVRFGDQEPVDVKLEFTWEFLSAIGGSGIPTIEDALKQRGEAASWITSSIDPCEPYAVDIEVEYTPICKTVEREIFLLSNFRWEELAHDFKQASVSVTGKCNVASVGDTRAA